MLKIGNVNNQFALSLLIIALGYFFKKINILKDEDGDSLSRIIFNITLPALIISTFNSMKIENSLIFISLISMGYGLIMSSLGILLFRKESNKLRGTFSMLVPGFNVGLFAYPLVQAIWGSNGLKYFGMFDMGNSITIFVFCYIIASFYSSDNPDVNPKNILKKLVTSIPLMSYVVTLAINLCGVHYPLPFVNVCNILSKANMPLSLLLLGICLNFSIDKKYLKSIIKVLVSRYSIGLVLGSILFVVMPFDPLFRYTLLIGLTLPIGMAVVPYAVQFNYDKTIIGTLCSITIIFSFLLTWIIVAL